MLSGVYFDASEVWQADPGNPANNAVTLSRTGNAYHFIPPTRPSSCGSMSIFTDGSIPTAGVSIGVGVSGQTAFACQATPNFDFNFMPHPEYWVAFGDFTEGEVLDFNRLSHSYKVQFPVNMYSMSLNFNPDNTWSESGQLKM